MQAMRYPVEGLVGGAGGVAAVCLAWVAYGLFYLAVLALVVGLPIGLAVLLGGILLS